MGSSAIFVVVFFIAVVILILYIISVAANRAYQDYQALLQVNQAKLIETRKKQDWIKEHMILEWPIWPRPLLFKDIDYSTQLALGRSYHANEQIELINGKIKPIQPLPASLAAIFNVLANFQRLIDHSQNKQQFIEFDKNCQLIDAAYETIVKNRREINAIKKEVRKKVEITTKDLESSSDNIQFFQRLGTVRYQDAIQNIEIAQACVDRAHVELANAVQEDLIEWVAADLLCFTGLLSLSIFKLKGRCYIFSETFEADFVLNRLAELTYDLEDVLDYQTLHQWRQLVYQKNQFLRLAEEVVESEKSLQDFEDKVRYFNRLILQLTKTNVREVASRTLRAQTDLEAYIGTPAETGEWGRILSRYKLPSLMLEETKTQFTRDIEPSIQGTIIKQSELLKIIRSLEEFLKGIQKIQALIRRIEGVTQLYVKCERDVKQLLGRNGEVDRLINIIYGFADDTAEEIKRECIVYINDFKNLSNLAFGDRKIARYPVLLENVWGFKDDCVNLILRHEDLIRSLQNKANNYYRELRRLQHMLVEYQYKRPIIEYDWASVIQQYNQIISMYDARGNRYTAIAAFNEAVEAYLDEKSALRMALEQQHQEYQRAVDEIRRVVATAQRQINRRIAELSKHWVNPLSDYIHQLKQYEEGYTRIVAQLQTMGNEKSMDEVMEFCAAVIRSMPEQMVQQKVIMDEAVNLKVDLDRHRDHVIRLQADKKLTEYNMKAVSDANMFILAAQNTVDPLEAKKYLDGARITLERANLPAPATQLHLEDMQRYEDSSPDAAGDSSTWNPNQDSPRGRK